MSSQRDTLFYPDEDRTWLQPYLPPSSSPPTDRPHVTLTFATSLDSALSIAPGTQTALSGPRSKAMTHYLRSRHDAILIGVGTAVADDPSLNCRLDGTGGYGGQGLEGQPRPVVVDPHCRWQVSRESKVVRLAREGRGKAPWVVTTAEEMPVPSVEALEAVGGQYVYINSREERGRQQIDWDEILAELRRRGIKSVMIEGGGTVINSLLSTQYAHLVDSIIVTIAPTWLGSGGVVVSPPRDTGPEGQRMPVARLKQPQWHQLGDDVVLCGGLK